MARTLSKYWWLLGFFVVALPLAPLALWDAGFGGEDWNTHLWFARYFAAFLAHYHHFPWDLNSYAVGIPSPIFYAYIFEPLMGVLSLAVGPQLAMRLVIFAVKYLEFFLVRRAFFKTTNNAVLSLFAAIVVVWTIYPFTNVFSRGAIPEYFATTLLTCALCAWLIMLLSENISGRVLHALLCAICVALFTGTHPITTMFGGIFLAVAFPLTALFFTRNQPAKRLEIFFIGVAVFLFNVIFLSPWLYANLKFMGHLQISNVTLVTHFKNDIDAFWTRFSVLPFDKRVLLNGPGVETAYLDAQANMPLFFLVLGLAFYARKSLAKSKAGFLIAAGVFFFGMASWMSLSKTPYFHLPRIFHVVEYAYRLVTYQNLALFLILYVLLTVSKKAPLALLTVIVAISALVTVERLVHSFARRNANVLPGAGLAMPPDADIFKKPEWLPCGMYITDSLTELDDSEYQPERVHFDVGTGDKFGEILSADFEAKKEGWYITNAVAFDWNNVSVDGAPVPRENLRRKIQCFVGVHLSAGKHVLEDKFEPPMILKLLRGLSITSLVIVGLLFAASFLNSLTETFTSLKRKRTTDGAKS